MSKKRLAVFLDGTWNTPEDKTSVHRLYEMTLVGVAPDELEQRTFYRTGVGSKWSERFSGGAFGVGLSRNVLDAYRWLVENYTEGADIYLFGFSRGAYTARSLGGVVVNCGLLRQGASLTPEGIYERYRAGKEAEPIYRLEFLQRSGGRPLIDTEQCLLTDSRRVRIQVLAVWDTVGALGVPWTAAPLVGRREFYFHNTNPSTIHDHCYHALAIDEHRAPYKPTFWTRFTSQGKDPKTDLHVAPPHIEQRWFVGAHSNVGGGYQNDCLCQLPLAWMQEKVAAHGLAFSSLIRAAPGDIDATPVDSFAEFMKGFYKIVRLGNRYHRQIGAASRQVKQGWSTSINETIDGSVFAKYRKDSAYSPPNLQDWARAKGVDLAATSGDQKA
ncbi:DUF2235 domain-containing protein [Stenotrophomonas lacuserhaii]|uniref:DUF2235 domain-containing protein n=1 Tax=Stenotrophomonas lacuserhaii TaxID=2760084 RepID=UPI0015FAC1FD|nr:DUF2235 domain-containing protein [Stenotrophomonas lacuserhaii]